MAEGNKDIVLSIRGMSKSFGRNKVLKHIDMDVPRGSIMGLMGENGAGKSTMMKCLFGTYQKDEGTIILDGKASESTIDGWFKPAVELLKPLYEVLRQEIMKSDYIQLA